MIYLNVIMTLIFIVFVFIGFFMMAIWRAILGKASVDLKTQVTLDKNTKKLETFNKSLGGYAQEQNNIKNEIKEVGGLIKELIRKTTDAKKH